MTTSTLLWILVPANLPVYLFLGWVVFDDARNASSNFLETLVAIIKAILIPRVIRVALGDDSDEGSIFNVVVFLGAAIAAVAGEYYLITRVLFPDSFDLG